MGLLGTPETSIYSKASVVKVTPLPLRSTILSPEDTEMQLFIAVSALVAVNSMSAVTVTLTFPVLSNAVLSSAHVSTDTAVAALTVEKLSPTTKKPGDIKWNFTKFLVDRNGNVIGKISDLNVGGLRRLAYDADGNVIGYIDEDGSVRDFDGNLIGYYEKHEYRHKETAPLYDFSRSLI